MNVSKVINEGKRKDELLVELAEKIDGLSEKVQVLQYVIIFLSLIVCVAFIKKYTGY